MHNTTKHYKKNIISNPYHILNGGSVEKKIRVNSVLLEGKKMKQF